MRKMTLHHLPYIFREAIPVPAEEILGESGETLADYKFRIRMQPSEFVRKVTKFLNVADIDENVKDKIAFGVALGISLSSQVRECEGKSFA